MKILHIIDSLSLGGAQTLLKGIFESRSDNNLYLYPLRNKKITIEINNENIFKNNFKKKYSFKPLKELKKIIEEEKIDVIHCHLFKSQLFGYLLKKNYFPNIKLIIHEHGEIFENKFYYNKFMQIAQEEVDLYIAVSNATKKYLINKSKITENKIKVLYNFVDLEKFNRKNITWNIKKEREKLGIKKDEFVIGFAGRLIEIKGWREFVESAKNLKDIKFIIVGEGEEKILLKKRIKNLKNIVYLGYYSEMVKFYSLLDIFIIPSHRESMGLTQLESQACGCPVIASNIEGLNETINDKKNCLLFDVKKIKNLIEKIEELYENKKLREKLIRGGLQNSKNYSLKKYLLKLDKIYNM